MQNKHVSKLTRTAFSQVPIPLLEQLIQLNKKSWLCVYLWLWHYAGREDCAWPSVGRLALESKVEDREVRKALSWLADQGWIEREERPGCTSVYHVRTERAATPNPWGKYPGGNHPGGECPTPGGNTPGVITPPEQEVRIKPRNKPIPPSLRSGGAGGTPRKRVAQIDGEGQGKVFRPTPDEIPAELLPVQVELLEFWREKAGSRSRGAWRVLLTELGKIQQAVGGGTECVRTQLQQATQCGWRSVTHRNWLAYGQPRKLPSRQSRQAEAVENVIAFFNQQNQSPEDPWPLTLSTSPAPWLESSSSSNSPSPWMKLA